jgi:hypothetical protein
MQDQLLECAPPLRDDEEADGGPAGGEDLLDRPATGDELFVRPEQVRSGQRRSRAGPKRRSGTGR